MRKPWQSPLLVILLLALILRLISIADHSLWYDEAFAVLFAEKGLDAMLYGTLTPVAGGAADIHPLLYYTTLNIWMTFCGQSPFAVRLWSTLLGAACVYVIYHLGKLLFSSRTGLAAALLVAIMPYHIHYSQETRMYTLLSLFLLAATWAFVKAGQQSVISGQPSADNNQDTGARYIAPSQPENLSKPTREFDSKPQTRRANNQQETKSQQRTAHASFFSPSAALSTQHLKYWLLFGLCAGLAMYTQQLAAFYLLAIGLVPLFTRRREQILGMALGTGVALLVYLPWLVNIPSQLQKVNSYYWVTQPGIDKPIVTLYLFLTTNAEIQPPLSLIGLVGAVFLLALALVQVIIYARKPRRSSESDMPKVAFILWLFAAPMALMWLVSQIQPVYLDRGLIASAVMLYLFLAWFFTRSGLPRPIRLFMTLVVILQVVIGLREQYNLSTFPYSPVADLLVAVRDEWQNGDVIVHQSKLSMLPGIYHDPTLTQRFIADIPGSPNDTLALPTQEVLAVRADDCIQTATRDAQRVWFVVYERAEREAAAAGIPILQEQFEWLTANYTLIEKTTFNDLNLYLYANPAPAIRHECPVIK